MDTNEHELLNPSTKLPPSLMSYGEAQQDKTGGNGGNGVSPQATTTSTRSGISSKRTTNFFYKTLFPLLPPVKII
jgi:hypothetical protein